MRLSDILERLKTEESKWTDIEVLIDATGIPSYLVNFRFDISAPFTSKAFVQWRCSDTDVGWKVIYMMDDPVALSFQRFRKSSNEITWIGAGCDTVKEWALSNLEFDKTANKIYKLDHYILFQADDVLNYSINVLDEETVV